MSESNISGRAAIVAIVQRLRPADLELLYPEGPASRAKGDSAR